MSDSAGNACPSGLKQSVVNESFRVAGIPVYQRAGYELFGDSIKGGPDGVMELWPMRRRPLECRVATEQDFYTLAQLHREAFQPTKWYQALWGQVEPQAFEEWLLPQLKQWAKNTSDRLVIAVRGNTVLGYAHWEIKHGPQEWSEEQAGTLGAAHPVGTNVEVASAFSRDMGRYNASVEGDYWRKVDVPVFFATLVADAVRS